MLCMCVVGVLRTIRGGVRLFSELRTYELKSVENVAVSDSLGFGAVDRNE